MKSRRRALGLISYVTPVALPIFIVLFYTPMIAVPVRVQGWTRGAALSVGFLLSMAWLVVGTGIVAVIPARFAKLKGALEFGILGLPLLGMIVILLWALVATLWRLAH